MRPGSAVFALNGVLLGVSAWSYSPATSQEFRVRERVIEKATIWAVREPCRDATDMPIPCVGNVTPRELAMVGHRVFDTFRGTVTSMDVRKVYWVESPWLDIEARGKKLIVTVKEPRYVILRRQPDAD